MDTYPQMRNTLNIILAAAGLTLLLGAIPVSAQTIVGLDPSSSGAISVTFNGEGSPIQVVLPAVLSGTGYEFDSGGTATIFGPAASDLTPFSSSDQGTTLSLDGGAPTPVSWVDIGGGGLPGILILQFTTPLQSASFPYDDLILNMNCCSGLPPAGNSGAITDDYDSLTLESGPITVTPGSPYPCGPLDLDVCYTPTIYAPNPLTVTAYVSSGEVLLGTPLPTPEPSSLSLSAIGLIAIFGSGVVRRKVSRA